MVFINTRSLLQHFSLTSHVLCTPLNQVTFDALTYFNKKRLLNIVFTLKVFKVQALNRLLALRGHVTNASFKQWAGTFLMPEHIKIILHPKFERKRI